MNESRVKIFKTDSSFFEENSLTKTMYSL